MNPWKLGLPASWRYIECPRCAAKPFANCTGLLYGSHHIERERAAQEAIERGQKETAK